MKPIHLVPVALLCLLLACNDDTPAEPTPLKPFEGTWQITYYQNFHDIDSTESFHANGVTMLRTGDSTLTCTYTLTHRVNQTESEYRYTWSGKIVAARKVTFTIERHILPAGTLDGTWETTTDYPGDRSWFSTGIYSIENHPSVYYWWEGRYTEVLD